MILFYICGMTQRVMSKLIPFKKELSNNIEKKLFSLFGKKFNQLLDIIIRNFIRKFILNI